MQLKNYSFLPLAIAIATGALVPGAASFAAAHAAKPAAQKKSAAVEPAPAPLAGQTAVAGGPPALAAKAWLLMDFDSGEVLASANPDEPLPPASLTKMMTSFLVEQALRSGKLKKDDLVPVSQYAWCRGSGTESCMYLPLNSQATVIDILRGIIVQSGNDASKAIAEHMAGSEEGFAKLMNAEAQRLGMTHTHFVNATGLPDPDHKSSARDLAILARAIIRDSSDYYPIYAEREFKYNNIKQGNRNALLYTDPTVDGLKTGHTQEAGYCLVTSSKRNGMRLITVMLNTNSAQARADQTRTLLGWGYANFEKANPIEPTAVVATPKVTFGKADTVAAGLGAPWTVTVPRGQKVSTSVQVQPGLEAPVAKGAVIGKIVAESNGKPVGEAPLVAQADVERAGFMLRLWQRVTGLFGK
ncbi:D-alanyl-D-alanine carboxypeptidase family protein [Variovorax arabinosiphilus]|uniref:D-alanyl-D-alanine carboxypeptidase family protein n=1 Tax=Variovorax arabinosiphilus TaxID=3053498 RepID=UPI00257717F4|nr:MULTISPECIES: D-alanyl-D-alanine carboxypeptidase family protein [unclassified Variovorax]MDM0119663.1 D-alanyl-D-alanine carboxypeptidase family protein [Variovorax sp. J2L1-78]MDM0128425.1 D-alanyl-D-alanine carboxypeptidase family protein [Variovorax sp. J2L1-63]MDM0232125.1 D-alanyl-D-alanine carboxypeptidase family protein [Variovorax sp. J2R1-6]